MLKGDEKDQGTQPGSDGASSMVTVAVSGGSMPNELKEDGKLLERIKGGLDVLIDEMDTTKTDLDIWLTLGPAEPREFPVFSGGDVELEIETIKKRLRDERRELKAKRRGVRPKIFMARDFKRKMADMPEPVDADMVSSVGQVSLDLMELYFKKGAETKWDSPERGIPHDYDTTDGGGSYKGRNPDAWLPGVFLTDEIFRALLWTLYKKIELASKQGSTARAKLDEFVKAITSGENGRDPDADRFLPFINHHERALPGRKPDPTYIKLVHKKDGTILGAIVQVGDWAGGSHSNGSGIHYPDK